MASPKRKQYLDKAHRDVIEAAMKRPFEQKLAETRAMIIKWDRLTRGNWSVSFSGGLDSTVLLHIARDLFPHCPAYFSDTGLEYPEIKDFVKEHENVTVIRPKLTFRQVIEKCGYPVVSKRISQYVKEVQRAKGETATKHLRLTGYKSDGTYSRLGKIPEKWMYLIEAPFKIGDRCCYHLKKAPLNKMPFPLVGVRVEESNQRLVTYAQYGAFGKKLKNPRAWPIWSWREDDIWEYIDRYNLPVASVYEGEDPLKRTGCMFCMFGVHLEHPNKFQLMAITHPKQYAYCLDNLGLREVLDYLGVDYSPWTRWSGR